MPAAHLQPLLKFLAMSRTRLLYGLDRTPDDRLSWSPGEEAPTPLRLAGKTARMIGFVTHALQHRTFPERPATPEDPPANREEAKAAVDAAFAALRGAVLGLSDADLSATVPAPWGESTLAEMVWWIPALVGYQQGQLNLIQMTYGDQDPNIPPNWGKEEV